MYNVIYIYVITSVFQIGKVIPFGVYHIALT